MNQSNLPPLLSGVGLLAANFVDKAALLVVMELGARGVPGPPSRKPSAGTTTPSTTTSTVSRPTVSPASTERKTSPALSVDMLWSPPSPEATGITLRLDYCSHEAAPPPPAARSPAQDAATLHRRDARGILDRTQSSTQHPSVPRAPAARSAALRPAKRARQLWDRAVLPKLGKRKVANIQRPDIAKLMTSLATTPAMAIKTLTLWSKAFKLAEAWGWRPEGTNPCRQSKGSRKRVASAISPSLSDRGETPLTAPTGALSRSEAGLVGWPSRPPADPLILRVSRNRIRPA